LNFIAQIHVIRPKYRYTISGTDTVAKRFRPSHSVRGDGNRFSIREKYEKAPSETITHLREDIGKVEEPQLRAMFETSAEVLPPRVANLERVIGVNDLAQFTPR
jgi:hypothetical protein